MVRLAAILVAVCAAAGAALSQPVAVPTETVTVTGMREREVVQDFVNARTVPTHFAEKIARWETPICAYVVGIKPEAAAFVLARINAVAKDAGAHVSDDPKCTYNIEVVFTRTPQALMDDVRKTSTEVLGYAAGSDAKDKAARVIRPIQSWYVTQTRDNNGTAERDSARTVNSAGVIMYLPCSMLQPPPADPGMCSLHNPYMRKMAVKGTFTGDGTRSLLENVLIVADPGKLTDYELGTVSDYIALLAVAQLPAPEGCQALATILNLFSEGCGSKSASLTDIDRAYLRGLYQMPGDLNLALQRGAIAAEMMKAATAEPAP